MTPQNLFVITAKELDNYEMEEHDHLVFKHDLFRHELEHGYQPPMAKSTPLLCRVCQKGGPPFLLSSPFIKEKYRSLLEGLEILEVN